ncbi:hypothetical protein [Desulfovibrio sp. Huiquan2017]|uniref:hypothetical protein n=1 Tax=Desulfovibrio sp. Huiquan2017 TaxID=2816861 RepID=UPI001A932B43|nr:hypothetical protein [Desulfovibrio sp. Huiquan2017]
MEIVIMILGAAVLFGALVRNGGGTTNWSAGEDDGEGWQSMFGDDGIGITSTDDMFCDDDADLLNNDDVYYSPIYSHLPCNIHYDSSSDFLLSDYDFMSSSPSAFGDDDWPSSSIDDDFCGCSSIGIDDDICGCGCLSFDDDGIGIGCGMWDD